MVEGGMKCVKYLLFTFNLIFFLVGLGLIICGGIVQMKFSEYSQIVGSSFSSAAILLIVVGAVIFVIGFFGCCGAHKENYCMTMTFAILLGLIFILEIAAGITAYVMKNNVKDFMSKELKKSLKEYPTSVPVQKAWNAAQSTFECCGVTTYEDWKNTLKNSSVPDSCCMKNSTDTGCGKKFFDKPQGHLYTKGCVDSMEEMVKSKIVIIGGIGIGVAFIQVFGILIACCLATAIRKEYEVI